MKLNEAKKGVISKAEFNDALGDFDITSIMRVFIQVLDKYNFVDVKTKKSLMSDAKSMDHSSGINSQYFKDKGANLDVRLSGKSGTTLRFNFEPKLNKLHYNVTFFYGKNKKQNMEHLDFIKPIHTTNKTIFEVFDEMIKTLLPAIEKTPEELYDYFNELRRGRTYDFNPKLKGVDLILKTLLRMFPMFEKSYGSSGMVEIKLNKDFFYNRITKPIKDAGLDLGIYLDEFRFAFQRKEFMKFFNMLVMQMKKIDYYIDYIGVDQRVVQIRYNYFKDGKDAYYTKVARKKNEFGEMVIYHEKTWGKGDHNFKQYIVKEFNKIRKESDYSIEINSLEELEAFYMFNAWQLMESWSTND